MNKAEKMAKLTKESAYEKYSYSIAKALRLIESNAQQGLNYCTLNFTDFPKAKETGFRLWFIEEGFNFREYNTNSITIIW